MHLNINSVILFALLGCTACGGNKDEARQPDIPFDKQKWAAKTAEGKFPYRKQMINDVMNNYKWTGITKDSLIRMLGQPDEREGSDLMYTYDKQPMLGGIGTAIESIVFEMAGDTVKLARYSDGGWD